MAKKKITFSVRVPDGHGGGGWIDGPSITCQRKWAEKFDTYEAAAEAAVKANRARGLEGFNVAGNY